MLFSDALMVDHASTLRMWKMPTPIGSGLRRSHSLRPAEVAIAAPDSKRVAADGTPLALLGYEAKGVPGIDGMTVEDLGLALRVQWEAIRTESLNDRNRPNLSGR
jgi:hypothetical protein